MKRMLKKYYPKDLTFCMYSDDCSVICPRKISDYELHLLNQKVSWQSFKNTNECQLKKREDKQA